VLKKIQICINVENLGADEARPVYLFQDLVDVSIGVRWLQLLLHNQAIDFVQHENRLYALVPGLLQHNLKYQSNNHCSGSNILN